MSTEHPHELIETDFGVITALRRLTPKEIEYGNLRRLRSKATSKAQSPKTNATAYRKKKTSGGKRHVR